MNLLSRRLCLGLPWIAALLAVALLAYWQHQPRPRAKPNERVSATRWLSREDVAGFARARTQRAFVFPADHGPHPTFRSEWWYYTGSLEGPDGGLFGFQLTFFRSALAPRVPARSSAWATRDVWMAHLAVTDVAKARFEARQRLSRDGLGLAGAQAAPFAVWLGDFSVRDSRLLAMDGGCGVDLAIDASSAPVAHGLSGLSRKGRADGNASYYYSRSRMPTQGRVWIDGDSFEVRGQTWMDHEWSTSALEADQVGWDWFGLQLEDGRDLMLFNLRRADGIPDEMGQGSVIVGSQVRSLTQAEFSIEVLEVWRSPASGVRYPARWRITIPTLDLELELTPLLSGQELRLDVRYWEGAVQVTGSVRGRGYVELVGYE